MYKHLILRYYSVTKPQDGPGQDRTSKFVLVFGIGKTAGFEYGFFGKISAENGAAVVWP